MLRHLPPLLPEGRRRSTVTGRNAVAGSARPRAVTGQAPKAFPSVAKAAGPKTALGPGSVNDFFSRMSRGLEEEGTEIKEEGHALQEHLRVQARLKRAKSSTRLPRDLLGGVRQSPSRSASCSALPAISAPLRPGRFEWETHDLAWERFLEAPPDTLYVESVPWPPNVDDVLEFYEELQTEGDRKKAYRLACQRWHPDKFLQRYGASVPDSERPYMEFRLNELFQGITTQWELTKRTLAGRR